MPEGECPTNGARTVKISRSARAVLKGIGHRDLMIAIVMVSRIRLPMANSLLLLAFPCTCRVAAHGCKK